MARNTYHTCQVCDKILKKRTNGRPAMICTDCDNRMYVGMLYSDGKYTGAEHTAHKMIKSAEFRDSYPITVVAEDIISIWPKDGRCPILKLKLQKTKKGLSIDSSASMDRLNNNNGYTPENIQIISNLANKMKSSATNEQLHLFADWIKENVNET